MASAFSPSVFAPHVFAQGAFGNRQGQQSVEAPAPSKGSGSSYDEYFRRQYEKQRIRENNEEIIEIVKILLKQGIL